MFLGMDKISENRLRRMAERQGLQLVKSRRRDPHAVGFGTYMLMNPPTNSVVHMNFALPGGYGLDLDDVESYLTTRAGQDEED